MNYFDIKIKELNLKNLVSIKNITVNYKNNPRLKVYRNSLKIIIDVNRKISAWFINSTCISIRISIGKI